MFSHLDLQLPDGVVSQYLLVSQGHLKRTKTAPPSLGPVALALYLPSLLQVRYHDNGGGLLLPDQSPEVHQGLGQRTCMYEDSHNTHSR